MGISLCSFLVMMLLFMYYQDGNLSEQGLAIETVKIQLEETVLNDPILLELGFCESFG